MINIKVCITNISAERFWAEQQPIPSAHISFNLNILNIENKQKTSFELPFLATVTYSPSIAQISFKGKACVKGDKKELKKIYKSYKQKKPPQVLMNAIASVTFAESILMARTLHVPSPIPTPMHQAKHKGRSSYTV